MQEYGVILPNEFVTMAEACPWLGAIAHNWTLKLMFLHQSNQLQNRLQDRVSPKDISKAKKAI